MTTMQIDRAVVEQALEALEKVGLRADARRGCDDAVGILRAALAQQAEPVATLIAQRDALLEVLRYIGEYRGEGPCTTPWQNIVADLGEKARAAIKAVEDEPVQPVALYTAPSRCPNCASLEAQNTELDRKLAELEGRPCRR